MEQNDTEIFLSTPSARRATRRAGSSTNPTTNFYPRPPRGGRQQHSIPAQHGRHISIHALREEGDFGIPTGVANLQVFLSTPSARRATAVVYDSVPDDVYFYPRPPRGGRRFKRDYSLLTTIFLSTPSARRATLVFLHVHANGENFYPRPPRGGRPPHSGRRSSPRRISIHALREEGDSGQPRAGRR